MSEREYQQRMLKSESKIVICDWDRGSGKSYSIAKHIESKDRGSILVVCANSNQSYHLHDKLIDNIDKKINCGYRINNIYNNNLNDTDDSKIKLKIDIATMSNVKMLCDRRYDYIYLDDISLMYGIDFGIYESMSYKQMVITASFNDCRHVDYIHYTSKLNENDWIEQEIKKLMKEFSEIPNDGNTTKRRESVLGMIRELKLMKNNDIEIKTESGAVIGTICRPSGTCDDGFFKGGM